MGFVISIQIIMCRDAGRARILSVAAPIQYRVLHSTHPPCVTNAPPSRSYLQNCGVRAHHDAPEHPANEITQLR